MRESTLSRRVLSFFFPLSLSLSLSLSSSVEFVKKLKCKSNNHSKDGRRGNHHTSSRFVKVLSVVVVDCVQGSNVHLTSGEARNKGIAGHERFKVEKKLAFNVAVAVVPRLLDVRQERSADTVGTAGFNMEGELGELSNNFAVHVVVVVVVVVVVTAVFGFNANARNVRAACRAHHAAVAAINGGGSKPVLFGSDTAVKCCKRRGAWNAVGNARLPLCRIARVFVICAREVSGARSTFIASARALSLWVQKAWQAFLFALLRFRAFAHWIWARSVFIVTATATVTAVAYEFAHESAEESAEQVAKAIGATVKNVFGTLASKVFRAALDVRNAKGGCFGRARTRKQAGTLRALGRLRALAIECRVVGVAFC